MYRPLSLDLKTNEGGRYCNNQAELESELPVCKFKF